MFWKFVSSQQPFLVESLGCFLVELILGVLHFLGQTLDNHGIFQNLETQSLNSEFELNFLPFGGAGKTPSIKRVLPMHVYVAFMLMLLQHFAMALRTEQRTFIEFDLKISTAMPAVQGVCNDAVLLQRRTVFWHVQECLRQPTFFKANECFSQRRTSSTSKDFKKASHRQPIIYKVFYTIELLSNCHWKTGLLIITLLDNISCGPVDLLEPHSRCQGA